MSYAQIDAGARVREIIAGRSNERCTIGELDREMAAMGLSLNERMRIKTNIDNRWRRQDWERSAAVAVHAASPRPQPSTIDHVSNVQAGGSIQSIGYSAPLARVEQQQGLGAWFGSPPRQSDRMGPRANPIVEISASGERTVKILDPGLSNELRGRRITSLDDGDHLSEDQWERLLKDRRSMERRELEIACHRSGIQPRRYSLAR